MDISYYSYQKEKGLVQWAGANNPLWIIRKGSEEVEEIKADKQPIGKFIHHRPFTNHEVKVNPGDCLYVFTDGFADQFGGERGKKFKDKPFKDFLVSISKEVMDVQGFRIEQKFHQWKGDFEQVDDICLIGFRI
jgi:serine phosphatase RsbU (regulator of sigma subunit)